MGDLATGLGIGSAQGFMNMFSTIGANRRMKKFWDMQNRYNHPKEQVKRLREAGLNPALMYGKSASPGIAGDVGSPEKTDVPSLTEAGMFGAEKRRTEATTDNLLSAASVNANRNVLIAEKAKTEGEIAGKTKVEKDLLAANFHNSVEAAELMNQFTSEKILGQQLDNDFKDATMKRRIKDVFLRSRYINSQLTGQDKINALRQLEIELKRIGIERNDPWYFRIFARNPEIINYRP